MKTALIIHGMPSEEEYLNAQTPCESNKHWIPWLQKQLILHDIPTQTPEMPKPYHPVYDSWKELFQQFQINDESFLIGHSYGGGFLLRYLSENQIPVDTVILIAPWIDTEKSLDTKFFDFEIDDDLIKRIKQLLIFYSTDDDKEILTSIEIIKQHLPSTTFKVYSDKGHFVTGSMQTSTFPELLEELV